MKRLFSRLAKKWCEAVGDGEDQICVELAIFAVVVLGWLTVAGVMMVLGWL